MTLTEHYLTGHNLLPIWVYGVMDEHFWLLPRNSRFESEWTHCVTINKHSQDSIGAGCGGAGTLIRRI